MPRQPPSLCPVIPPRSHVSLHCSHIFQEEWFDLLQQLDKVQGDLEEVLSQWSDLERGLDDELGRIKHMFSSLQTRLPESFDLLQMELRKTKVTFTLT